GPRAARTDWDRGAGDTGPRHAAAAGTDREQRIAARADDNSPAARARSALRPARRRPTRSHRDRVAHNDRSVGVGRAPKAVRCAVAPCEWPLAGAGALPRPAAARRPASPPPPAASRTMELAAAAAVVAADRAPPTVADCARNPRTDRSGRSSGPARREGR